MRHLHLLEEEYELILNTLAFYKLTHMDVARKTDHEKFKEFCTKQADKADDLLRILRNCPF